MTGYFWSDARIRRVGIITLLGILIALPIAFFRDNTGLSMVKSGDFPGFYVQAEILKRGLANRLYDPELQRAIENEFWPSFGGAFYMAAYPPYTAVLLYPLSFFSPQTAQNIFVSIMCIFYVLSFWLLSAINPTLKNRAFGIGAFTIFLSTMIAALFGAQNTALSMLIACAAIYGIKLHTKRSLFAAGLLLGFWAFKPQFALFGSLFALLAAPSFALLLGIGCSFLILFLVGVGTIGITWPLTWIEVIQQFGTLNYVHNRQEMISIIGAIKGCAYNLLLPSGIFSVIGWTASAALFLFLLIQLRDKSRPAHIRFSLGIALLPLLSPQTLFYDLGIGIVGLLTIWNLKKDRDVWVYLTYIALSHLSFLFRETSPLAPFFPFAAALGIFSVCIFRRFHTLETLPVTAQKD